MLLKWLAPAVKLLWFSKSDDKSTRKKRSPQKLDSVTYSSVLMCIKNVFYLHKYMYKNVRYAALLTSLPLKCSQQKRQMKMFVE